MTMYIALRYTFALILFLFIGMSKPSSLGDMKAKFERKFTRTCSKYQFYHQHISLLQYPRSKFMLFIFHDPTLGNNGGLGDRLGGLISAFAFALRTNRTLLVAGDNSFDDAFQPYHPTEKINYSWANWSWSGRQKGEVWSNVKNLKNCVNPKPSQIQCALDADHPHTVVQYRGNRAYLCRWAKLKRKHHRSVDLQGTLGIGAEADLFEAAGCMLRMILWPTEKLWGSLAKALGSRWPVAPVFQVGIHFRCGDSSFAGGRLDVFNPQCLFNSSKSWKGTSFYDDHSLDSPVDAGLCGRRLLVNRSVAVSQDKKWAYLASDYKPSAQQIRETLRWPNTITLSQGCHIDLQSSDQCTLTTSVHWLMLALSDVIVMQSMIQPKAGPYTDVLHSDEAAKLQPMPVSAFSRYAAMYSLSNQGIRYGTHCEAVNQAMLSRQTQGNWVCNPRVFF